MVHITRFSKILLNVSEIFNYFTNYDKQRKDHNSSLFPCTAPFAECNGSKQIKKVSRNSVIKCFLFV